MTTLRNYRRHQIESLPAEYRSVRVLGESGRHTTSGLPSQRLSEMPLDQTLSGRMERRLPIIVVVCLAPAVSAATEGERTFTDNISPHGARIFSKQAWQAGDVVQVTPVNEDPVWAKVIYTQKLPDNRYNIGVQVQGLITWSILRRYDGLQSKLPSKSKSS
jgi:hypothetical protein